MTKQFIQYLDEIHRDIWQKSNEGKINDKEIKKSIKKIAGATVVDKYWEELHEFDRIEQVPEEQVWIVDKPESGEIGKSNVGERKAKYVKIPYDVLKAGEQFGVNFNTLMTEAIIEEVSSKENFIKDYLESDYTEKEAEFIFKLIKNGLAVEKGTKEQMAQKGKIRRDYYKDIFDKKVTSEEIEHIENLRKEAFNLKDTLNL